MKLVVDGQSIHLFGKEKDIADGSENFVKIEFDCSEDWNDYLVTAQFIQFGQTINIFLGEKRVCDLPGEIKDGPIVISLFGAKPGLPDKATNVGYETYIKKAAFSSTAKTPIPPTPDLYAQLLEEFSGESDADKVVAILNGTENEPIDLQNPEIVSNLESKIYKLGKNVINCPTVEYLSFGEGTIINVLKQQEGDVQFAYIMFFVGNILFYTTLIYSTDEQDVEPWESIEIGQQRSYEVKLLTTSESYLKVTSVESDDKTIYYVSISGIGSLEELQTKDKTNIVSAINSVLSDIEEKVSLFDIATKIESDNILALYSPSTNKINLRLTSSSLLDGGEIPSIFLREYISANSGMMATVSDGFMLFDVVTYKVLHYTKDGIEEYDDFSSIASQIKKFLAANRYRQFVALKYTYGVLRYSFLIIGSNKIGSSESYIRFYVGGNVAYCNEGKYEDAYFSQNNKQQMLGTSFNNQMYTQGPCEQTINVANNDSYGLIEFFAPNANEPKVGVTFGSKVWSNAQSIWNGKYGISATGAKTLCRALNEDGIEQIKIFGKTTTTYSGIDNNKHSVYCLADSDSCVCITSAGEILWRSFEDASIINRKTVETETDLFSNELQFCVLQICEKTLFAYNYNKLYVIDYLNNKPTALEVKWESPTNNHTLFKNFGKKLSIAPSYNYDVSQTLNKAQGSWLETISMHKEAKI